MRTGLGDDAFNRNVDDERLESRAHLYEFESCDFRICGSFPTDPESNSAILPIVKIESGLMLEFECSYLKVIPAAYNHVGSQESSDSEFLL